MVIKSKSNFLKKINILLIVFIALILLVTNIQAAVPEGGHAWDEIEVTNSFCSSILGSGRNCGSVNDGIYDLASMKAAVNNDYHNLGGTDRVLSRNEISRIMQDNDYGKDSIDIIENKDNAPGERTRGEPTQAEILFWASLVEKDTLMDLPCGAGQILVMNDNDKWECRSPYAKCEWKETNKCGANEIARGMMSFNGNNFIACCQDFAGKCSGTTKISAGHYCASSSECVGGQKTGIKKCLSFVQDENCQIKTIEEDCGPCTVNCATITVTVTTTNQGEGDYGDYDSGEDSTVYGPGAVPEPGTDPYTGYYSEGPGAVPEPGIDAFSGYISGNEQSFGDMPGLGGIGDHGANLGGEYPSETEVDDNTNDEYNAIAAMLLREYNAIEEQRQKVNEIATQEEKDAIEKANEKQEAIERARAETSTQISKINGGADSTGWQEYSSGNPDAETEKDVTVETNIPETSFEDDVNSDTKETDGTEQKIGDTTVDSETSNIIDRQWTTDSGESGWEPGTEFDTYATDFSGGDPEDGGEGGISVLCTEANRQGYISDEIYRADAEYAEKYIDETTMLGYHSWAKPLVTELRTSPKIAKTVIPLSVEWAKHMAFVMEKTKEDSEVGKILNQVGRPLSKELGELMKKDGYTKENEYLFDNEIVKEIVVSNLESLSINQSKKEFQKSLENFLEELKKAYEKDTKKDKTIIKILKFIENKNHLIK